MRPLHFLIKCGLWLKQLLSASYRLVPILGALDKGLHFHTYINDNRTEVNSIVGTALVDISYGIEPKVEHYGCVIDLLARAWLLEEAMELIGTMPMEPNPCALGPLLGGCRIHGNFELGEMVGKRLINLQPYQSGRYILLSNIYAAGKKWDDARKVHRFVAGDWSHPESNKIYEKLNEIHTRLKSAIGYSADTGNVLLDMEEEDKEHALAVHSEKLAIAYGLLHLDSKEAIRIVKNLRVCRD
uniref:DYW domain-containing protein n=1 Tax=Vitis vinifera TaxID=29760 RepID=A5AGN1_VITVI|nr:hypothetical protein VITISV_024006 [Vitis vinifera]